MIARTQQDYWNDRIRTWANMNVPLIPDQGDLDFQRAQLKPGGDTVVLGVTPQLCSLARSIAGSVTAVDFAKDVIAALRIDGVEYVHMDWLGYFTSHDQQFDNIITDGGLVCLQFPDQWQQLANHIRAHLKPGGIFSARVYINTLKPPKAKYNNPNLNRFVTNMGEVSGDWMVHPSHSAYAAYDMQYAFPPEDEVMRIFSGLTLLKKRVPDYEEGERFVSYAWQYA